MIHFRRHMFLPFAGFAAACAIVVAYPMAGTSAQEALTEAVNAENDVVVAAKEGEVLQIIVPDSRADRADVRQAYYRGVLPKAEALGYRRLGQLGIRQKVVSDYDPRAVLFFAWPDQSAMETFERDPEWPPLRTMRPLGWNELKIYTAPLEDDLSLRFRSDKFYTVVIAWFEDKTASDYDTYLTGIEPAVTRSGGRFLAKIRDLSYEGNAPVDGAPGQITFVEWDSPEGFAGVQQSPEYLAHRQYFASGVERFEFYWLQTPD